MKNKLKIKDNYDRKKLIEGRNYGIGFSILQKINRYSYKTLLPFSACKDYMNDLIYKTFYDKKLDFTCHGYKAETMKCYNKNHKYFYLGVNTLNYNKAGDWNKKRKASNILTKNAENLVKILNKLEDYINLDSRRISLYSKNSNTIVLKCPSFWMHKTYFISLLSLSIRLFFNIKKEDVNKKVEDIIKTHICFIDEDTYNLKFIKLFLDLKLTNRDLLMDYPALIDNATYKSKIHSAGIVSFISHCKKLK